MHLYSYIELISLIMKATDQFGQGAANSHPPQEGKREVVTNACALCKLRKTKCTGKAPCRTCQRDGVGDTCVIDEKFDLRFKNGMRRKICILEDQILALDSKNAHLRLTVAQYGYTIEQMKTQIGEGRTQRSQPNNQSRSVNENAALETIIIKKSDEDLTKLLGQVIAEISTRKISKKTQNEQGEASKAPGTHSNNSATGVVDQPALNTEKEHSMHLYTEFSETAQNLPRTATFVAPSQLGNPYSNSMAHVATPNINNWGNEMNSSIQQNPNGYQIPSDAVPAHENNNINQEHGNLSAPKLQTTGYSLTQSAMQQDNTPAQQFSLCQQNGYNMQTQQDPFQTPNMGHGFDQGYNYAQIGASQQESYMQQMGTAQDHQQTFGHQSNYNPQNDKFMPLSYIAPPSNPYQHSPYTNSGHEADVLNGLKPESRWRSFAALAAEDDFPMEHHFADHENFNMGYMNFSAGNLTQPMDSDQFGHVGSWY
ncbi:hypothetical protein IFR05_013667 [Cadophora sp. M221]|nr:hypothetical protein IFR05_013667 [Cadophora sp. M221]